MAEGTQVTQTDPTATTAQAGAVGGGTPPAGAVTGGAGPAAGSKGAVVTSGDGIIIDKNKSAEQYMKESEKKYIIPALVREKFPDLVKLIYETESMNDEEREYWMQIMPIMTEEQILKFRDILVNERDQLAKLDNEYEQEMGRIQARKVPEIDEAKLKEKMAEIKKKEKVKEEEEKAKEAALLKQLEGME